jgi:soluble lytic murein transglycosylase-like protein
MRRLTTPAAIMVFLAGSALAQTPPPFCVPDDAVDPGRVRRYDAIILRHAQRRRLNPRLVKAIIAAESQFATGAVSPKGARGLMQLMPATALEMGVPARSLSDPDANIRAGTKYLAVLFSALRRQGADDRGELGWAVRHVIAAYHSGPGALGSDDWPVSTRLYVRNVLSCYGSEASALRLAGSGGTYGETARSVVRAR